jgi:hypothetical protein
MILLYLAFSAPSRSIRLAGALACAKPGRAGALQRIAMTLSRMQATDTLLALVTSSYGSEARVASRLPLSLMVRNEIVPLKRCRCTLTKL